MHLPKEKVPVLESVGRVSADICYACPPGFPYLIHGELIQPEHIEFLRNHSEEIVVLKDFPTN